MSHKIKINYPFSSLIRKWGNNNDFVNIIYEANVKWKNDNLSGDVIMKILNRVDSNMNKWIKMGLNNNEINNRLKKYLEESQTFEKNALDPFADIDPLFYRNEDAKRRLKKMGLSDEEIEQQLRILKDSYNQPTAAEKTQLYNIEEAARVNEDAEKQRLFSEKTAQNMRNSIGITELQKQSKYSPENRAILAVQDAANEKYRLEKIDRFYERPENKLSKYQFRPIVPLTNESPTNISPTNISPTNISPTNISPEGSPRPVSNISPSQIVYNNSNNNSNNNNIEKGGKRKSRRYNSTSKRRRIRIKSKKSKRSRKMKKSRKR